MPEISEVIICFKLLVSVPAADEAKVLVLCEASLKEICRRLRGSVCEEYSEKIVFAAAALSLYRYKLLNESENGEFSFKGSEVSYAQKAGSASNSAYKLYCEAMKDLAPVLSDDEFMFSAVEG